MSKPISKSHLHDRVAANTGYLLPSMPRHPEEYSPTGTKDRAAANKEFWKRFFHHRRNPALLSWRDWKYARYLSMNWDTCACGSINDGLPRGFGSWRPRDNELQRLGELFFMQIKEQDYTHAKITFHDIQSRAAVVLYNKALDERANKEIDDEKR